MFTVLGVLFSIISILNAQYTYHSWTPQKYINYFVNPYISAQIEGGNQTAGNVYLKFHKEIRKEDNFQISVKVTNQDGSVISETVKVINLCDHLESQLGLPEPLAHGNILGLSGLRCPILVGDIQEMIDVQPFEWPLKHNYPNAVTCGVHKYHVTLYKCDRRAITCQKIIEAGVESLMTSRDCNRDAVPVKPVTDGPVTMSERRPINYNQAQSQQSTQKGADDKIKVSKSRMHDTKVQTVETVDADGHGQMTNHVLNNVEVVDGKVDEVQVVDGQTGKDFGVVNAEVNKVSVTKDNHENVQTMHDDEFDDYDDYDDDLRDLMNGDSYSNEVKGNKYYPPTNGDSYLPTNNNNNNDNTYNDPPNVKVSQIKTKDSDSSHFESVDDEIEGENMRETAVEEDHDVDAESNGMQVETFKGGEHNIIQSNLGTIIRGDTIKSKTLMHSN